MRPQLILCRKESLTIQDDGKGSTKWVKSSSSPQRAGEIPKSLKLKTSKKLGGLATNACVQGPLYIIF